MRGCRGDSDPVCERPVNSEVFVLAPPLMRTESSHYKADGEHTTATLALHCLSLICHLHSSCDSSSYLMGTIPFLAIFCCDRQEREARDLRTFNEAFPSSDQGCLDDTILSVIDGA